MALTEKNSNWAFNAGVDSKQTSAGVVRKILTYCDEAMCAENHFDTGGTGALHSHPHTQVAYIAGGVFEFTIGDTKRVVKKGDAMLMQNGVTHGCVCLEKGVVVDFFVPMRADFL